jgi:hypothetical protein
METGNKRKLTFKSTEILALLRPHFTVISLALKENISCLCMIENLH